VSLAGSDKIKSDGGSRAAKIVIVNTGKKFVETDTFSVFNVVWVVEGEI
jgi:hypothetical protein